MQKVMFQKAVRNYLAGFRRESVRKSYGNGELFEFVYFCVLPILLDGNRKKENILFYILIILPVLFCRFAEPMHPMALPKIMYLCPLSEEERRSFVRASGLLHLAVPVMLEMVSLAILGKLGLVDWISAEGILLGITMLSVWCCGMSRRKAERYKIIFDVATAEGVQKMLGVMWGILTIVVFVCMQCWDFPVNIRTKCIWLGAAAVLQIPLVIGRRSVWKKTVEEAAFYEKEGNL